MSNAKRMLRTCVDCGADTYDRYFRGERRSTSDGHGVSGWESDKPLCLRCARIAIWGTADPIWRPRRGKKSVALPDVKEIG
jgi:hypothetical protein